MWRHGRRWDASAPSNCLCFSLIQFMPVSCRRLLSVCPIKRRKNDEIYCLTELVPEIFDNLFWNWVDLAVEPCCLLLLFLAVSVYGCRRRRSAAHSPPDHSLDFGAKISSVHDRITSIHCLFLRVIPFVKSLHALSGAVFWVGFLDELHQFLFYLGIINWFDYKHFP